jgi:hypothetical protein
MVYSPYGAMLPYGSEYSPYGSEYSPYGAMMPMGGQPTGPLSTPFTTMGGQQGYQFVTNKGKPAQKGTTTGGFVPLVENAEYRISDLRGKNNVAASGTGAAGLQSVYDMARQLSTEGGKKANWAVQMLDPETNQWNRVAYDPKGTTIGSVLKGALNIAAPLALGGLTGLGVSKALGGGNGALSGSGKFQVGKGAGELNPIFSAQLPTANIPMAARQPRGMSGIDFYRYRMGAVQQFFERAPAAAPAMMSPQPVTMAEGGGVSHGRSDDVPALLSRGEYVIDAETMALLGNGDPMAGADMMDKWRVNVRKHKGSHLAKGGISPDAKTPDKYMGGGRT